MSELYKVYLLSSNVRTCFFYLNDSDLEDFASRGCSIKIQFGPDHKNITFGSVSLSSVPELPSKCIGVAPLFANKLGLKENEIVVLSHCSVDSVSSLELIPEKEEDYVILVSCKSLLEANLLNQVSIVSEGEIIPLYVFSNIPITVQIQNLNLQSGYGQLQKFTEIVVLHSSEKSKSQIKTKNENGLGNKDKEKQQSLYSVICSRISHTLESRINPKQIEVQKTAELFLKHVVEDNLSESIEYKIKPSLFLDKSLQNIKNKFIIISNFECARNNFGPNCLKFLAEIQKVNDSDKERGENDNNLKEDLVLYTYVVSLNNNEKYIAFCPSEVMTKLNLFVGSKIRVKQVKSSSKLNVTKFSESIINDREVLECFPESTAAFREKIRLTILNNFKYKYNINTLIIGGAGTGKTFFLKDIVNEFLSEFIFCSFIHCKSLRGKKVDSLQKILIEHLKDCAYQEPSLLLLDDLHALTYVDEEEGQFNKLYSNRVVDLLTDIIEKFQTKCNITVVATATTLSQLSSVVTRTGPRLFQDVLTIPEMNFNERNFSLKFILNRNPNITVDSSVDLNKLSASTNGYTLQDLNDVVDKAIFNCCLRNDTDENFPCISQEDFDLALSKSTPLSIRNVKLKQNIETKWENVGGMVEPKKVLTEVFSWPLKYPSVLESCPLRLQRGVLLYGAPGTGKTMLAGALANKCGLNFISVKGPEVLSKYVGASEEGVRNLFLQAEKTKPCLLFFDEFDSLAPKRGHDNTGVTDRVVNQLLTQLDGVEALNGVWVLAATSRPDLLDPALLRPGRLDKMVFCDVPNQEDRLSILEVLSENLFKCDDVRLLEIAEKTDGFTGADLQAVLYNAQMCAIKEEKNSLGKKSVVKIKQIHLLKALTDVKPSLSQREKARYQRIYEKFLNSRMRKVEPNIEELQRVTLA